MVLVACVGFDPTTVPSTQAVFDELKEATDVRRTGLRLRRRHLRVRGPPRDLPGVADRGPEPDPSPRLRIAARGTRLASDQSVFQTIGAPVTISVVPMWKVGGPSGSAVAVSS